MTQIHTTELTVEQCANPTEWNEFVDRADGSPFALWGWGDAVGTYGHDRRYLVARAGGTVVGALPLVRVRSRVFGDSLVSVPYTSQGELLATGQRPEAVRRELLARARALGDDMGVDVVTVRATDLGDPAEFTRHTDYVTFRIPTDVDAETAWDAMDGSRRTHVRTARDDPDLTYEVGDSLADLREYYRLYLQSMRGHGTPPHSFEFFRVLWDRLHDAGHLRLGLVRLDGDLVNASIDMMLGSTVVQKGVVLDYEHRDRQGGSLLTWKTIEWACDADYGVYDLGRTRPDTGIHHFKSTFGGEEADLVDYHYFPDGPVDLPDAEDETYDLPRRLWRKFPIAVTRLVGPHIRKNITL